MPRFRGFGTNFYFGHPFLDAWFAWFPPNQIQYGGAAVGEIYNVASRVDERKGASWISAFDFFAVRPTEGGARRRVDRLHLRSIRQRDVAGQCGRTCLVAPRLLEARLLQGRCGAVKLGWVDAVTSSHPSEEKCSYVEGKS